MHRLIPCNGLLSLALVPTLLVVCSTDNSAAALGVPPPAQRPRLVLQIAGQGFIGAHDESDVTAVITQISGGVSIVGITAVGENVSQEQLVRGAIPMQILRAGEIVRVPTGGYAGLVCSTERWIGLDGETSWQLTEAACSRGRELPPGTYLSVVPHAGRIHTLKGSEVIERDTREKESYYGAVPVVLSPRNTALIDPRPTIRWVAVANAIEYQVEIIGPTSFTVRVDADQIVCSPEGHGEGALTICSLPFPPDQPAREPGRKYFLKVSALLGIASPLRSSEEINKLTLLATDEAVQVGNQVEEIQTLDVDGVTRDLLLAGIYAGHGLYADAILAYQRALVVQPSPTVYVTLGDAYRAIKLYRFAYNSYQAALTQLGEVDDHASRAAVEFGIGHVYYNQGNYAEALTHFQIARTLYAQLLLAEEAYAAELAVEEARKRTRQQ